MTIIAKYEDGVFKPLVEVKVNEGTLVEVTVPSEGNQISKSRSIGDTGFFGLWKDREDIVDSVDFVNGLRRSLRS